MRGSLLLFGSTQQNRQDHACEIVSKELDKKIHWNYLTNYADIKIVEPLEEKKSIGIAQAREATSYLQEKPLALNLKILIINKANLLTDDAQNSLLKTLEEPPSYALILLLSKTEGALLPTILSRCRKIKTFERQDTEPEKFKETQSLMYVRALTLGSKLDWAEDTSKEEKDTIIEMLENWILEGRIQLNEDPTNTLAITLEKITSTLDDLENTNVGTRLALENLMLNMK